MPKKVGMLPTVQVFAVVCGWVRCRNAGVGFVSGEAVVKGGRLLRSQRDDRGTWWRNWVLDGMCGMKRRPYEVACFPKSRLHHVLHAVYIHAM